MISGVVTADHVPTLRLRLVGAGAKEIEIEFEIDTGFTGGLSLPLASIQSLGWPYQTKELATLGDGREVVMHTYRGIVMWRCQPRLIGVLAAEPKSLVGTGLLTGHKLTIDFNPGGAVTITPLA